ncbi:MAG: 3-phosphoserine/phosphohydroxythreonine transaminase [Polyangiales bacterium]
MNFSAGPAALPLPVLERARDELLDFAGTGMSVMEQSHRAAPYKAVHDEAQSLLRELLGVPDDYAVLLLQGGASALFAQIPLNFLSRGRRADYVVTGGWGEKALEEARRVGDARDLAAMQGRYTRIPGPEAHDFAADAAYAHITSNNTLEGTQYQDFPDAFSLPLVADMSSDFLWRPFDLSRFAMVYAGAQKNLGPSGVVIALARNDFLSSARVDIPRYLRFATHAEAGSLYNTPPTFAVYMVRNVLAWLRDLGGLAAMEARNRAKAAALYAALDAHAGFFRCPVEPAHRSTMNVVWRTASDDLDARFVREAEAAGMVGLKGHRSTGGIRASIYNAVEPESVDALAQFCREFARTRG